MLCWVTNPTLHTYSWYLYASYSIQFALIIIGLRPTWKNPHEKRPFSSIIWPGKIHKFSPSCWPVAIISCRWEPRLPNFPPNCNTVICFIRKRPSTKVSFFGMCSKMQIIPIKNLNIKKVVPQFLWFFRLKCWFKGQIISRIHLSLPNAYKLMCFDRNINGNRDVKFLIGIIGHCTDQRKLL